MTLNARASTRTGPPGDIGTGAAGGYLNNVSRKNTKFGGGDTIEGSIGFGRFC